MNAIENKIEYLPSLLKRRLPFWIRWHLSCVSQRRSLRTASPIHEGGLINFVSTNKIRDKYKRDNGNVHRAAAKDLQAVKAARPAAPCATYCYPTVLFLTCPMETRLSLRKRDRIPQPSSEGQLVFARNNSIAPSLIRGISHIRPDLFQRRE